MTALKIALVASLALNAWQLGWWLYGKWTALRFEREIDARIGKLQVKLSHPGFLVAHDPDERSRRAEPRQ